jgi:hypothetical protein
MLESRRKGKVASEKVKLGNGKREWGDYKQLVKASKLHIKMPHSGSNLRRPNDQTKVIAYDTQNLFCPHILGSTSPLENPRKSRDTMTPHSCGIMLVLSTEVPLRGGAVGMRYLSFIGGAHSNKCILPHIINEKEVPEGTPIDCVPQI